jgi:hypothetical protein
MKFRNKRWNFVCASDAKWTSEGRENYHCECLRVCTVFTLLSLVTEMTVSYYNTMEVTMYGDRHGDWGIYVSD